jgi:hypothetical protein
MKHLKETTLKDFLTVLKENGWEWYPLMEYARNDTKEYILS